MTVFEGFCGPSRLMDRRGFEDRLTAFRSNASAGLLSDPAALIRPAYGRLMVPAARSRRLTPTRSESLEMKIARRLACGPSPRLRLAGRPSQSDQARQRSASMNRTRIVGPDIVVKSRGNRPLGRLGGRFIGQPVRRSRGTESRMRRPSGFHSREMSPPS
jgi:hypothetical protein